MITTHTCLSRISLSWVALGLCAALGCDGKAPSLPPTNPAGSADSDPGVDLEPRPHPFPHEEQIRDIFADGNQIPPAQSAALHACGKLTYATLGRILASRGVNLEVPDSLPDSDPRRNSAGYLYRSGRLTLGAPVFTARVSEAGRSTTGGLARLYDILIASAQEFIDNVPRRPECQVAGVDPRLFNDKGRCNADGISCLLGMPASATLVSLCDDMVMRAKDPAIGRRLAVAAMASAAYVCD